MNINKKIFASALFIVGAFVSSIAAAQISYDNSVTDILNNVYAQDDNAVVTAGGGVARANDLLIYVGTGTANSDSDIPSDSTIVILLPDGLNFDGTPGYSVGPNAAAAGLTLVSDNGFEDPTLGTDTDGNPNVLVQLDDANGDGGNDRAEVTVKHFALAGDTLTISINVTADDDADTGVKKASIVVDGGLAVTQNLVEVVETDIDPLGNIGDPTEVSQAANNSVDTSATEFAITIPAGTAAGKTITFTPGSGITWDTNPLSSTLSWTVLSPVMANPLSATATANVNVGASTATISVATSTTTISLVTTAKNDDPVQVAFSISSADSLTGAVGLRKVTVAGTAGVEGTVSLFDAQANGSEATLSTGEEATTVVAGSSAQQSLPTIDIEENFDGDVGTTLTITADDGLTFITGGNVATGGISGTVSVNATSDVITITVTSNTDAFDSLTLENVTAIADSDASGDLGVTVAGTGTYAPDDDELVVADAVEVGVVEVSLSGTAKGVSTDGPSVTSIIDLNETTYGALSTAAETQVQDVYFRLTPSSNADITAVTTADSGYDAGASPTITACVAETNATTGAWLCEVTAESTAVEDGTSTISVSVTYATDDAAVGETVDITIDGNAAVEGAVTVANVKIATTADVTTAIPDLEPGDDTAKALATLEIAENFTGAITNGGSLRLVAPSGVAFQDAASVQAQTDIGTATITATFSPNDTLVLDVSATTSITVIAKAVVADGLSGKISVTIYDGDIDGNNGAGVTSEDVVLLYAGVLDTLDAGDDTDVNVGFKTTNTVEGGLAPYTVKSGNTGFATATIDGTTVTVTGVGAGVATITVTDDLGATDSFDVTVATGGTQPDATKAAKALDGSTTAATFTAGASSDGGTTYGTEFTTADSVTLVGTINVDPADQGSDGEVHVLVSSVTGAGVSIFSLDVDGKADAWDGSLEDIAANIVATPLGATYTVTIVSDEMLAAGTYRVALAYSTEGGKLVYTAKAMVITVTE